MIENIERYISILAFIKELERLKDTLRVARTKEGRRESVADHSWRLALFALVLEHDCKPLNFDKILRMCLVHDLGEAYDGDIPAVMQIDPKIKLAIEERALQRLFSPLPAHLQEEFLNICYEYNVGETKEAKFVKALDKLETLIQHNQGINEEHFDYSFNLTYGKHYSDLHDTLKQIRHIIDLETIQHMNQKEEF